MIVGRLEDYIDKISRACAAWRRQDASLAIPTYGQAFFVTALYTYLDLIDYEPDGTEQSYEDYPDEVFVGLYEAVKNRDADLRDGILAYFEKHDPRAKATAAQQLTLFE